MYNSGRAGQAGAVLISERREDEAKTEIQRVACVRARARAARERATRVPRGIGPSVRDVQADLMCDRLVNKALHRSAGDGIMYPRWLSARGRKGRGAWCDDANEIAAPFKGICV